MLFQPHVEFWSRHYCPKCSGENWTYHSHSQRHGIAIDPEICECHSYHQKYWLMDEADARYRYPDEDVSSDACGAEESLGWVNPG